MTDNYSIDNDIYYPMNPKLIVNFKDLQKNPNQTYMNLPFMFKTDNLDIEKLRYAINEITKRHESLRSTFNEKDGKFYQIVKQNMNIDIEIYDSIEMDSICKPFDIINGPLFRVGLYHNIVIFDFHHFIMDGYSMGILFIELNNFYSGRELKTKDLPRINELTVPDETLEQNKEYWKNRLIPLKKAIKENRCQVDKIQVGPCGMLYYPVNLDLYRKMKIFSMDNKLTPNIIASAAYVLLNKQRRNLDIIGIQTNMSTRNMHNLKSIGLFTNPVVMPFEVKYNYEIINFLTYISNQYDEFLKHQQYDFFSMLHEMNLNRSEISEATFVYQREMISEIKIDDQLYTPIPIPIKETQFNIAISFFASKEIPVLQLEYMSNLHSKDEMEAFLDDYIKILELILDSKMKTTDDIIQEISKPHNLYYGKLAKQPKGFCSIKELFEE